ncbi:hypothetical protein [Kibdelosporangium philippinense]
MSLHAFGVTVAALLHVQQPCFVPRVVGLLLPAEGGVRVAESPTASYACS